MLMIFFSCVGLVFLRIAEKDLLYIDFRLHRFIVYSENLNSKHDFAAQSKIF